MRINPEIVERPDFRLIYSFRQTVRLTGEALAVESEGQLRSYYWASALVQADFESNIPLRAGLSHVSAGFVGINERADLPLAVRESMAEGFSFGLFALVTADVDERAVFVLEIGNRSFPVAVVSGRVEHHGCPPYPQGTAHRPAGCEVVLDMDEDEKGRERNDRDDDD